MRILIIGPKHKQGGLTPYINSLSQALRHLGCYVDWIGSDTLPYDKEEGSFWSVNRIEETTLKILQSCSLETYDLLSIHFGKLEIEQLVPVLWENLARPPAVYHVHSIDWDLFREFLGRPDLAQAVVKSVYKMEGFVFFGQFAFQRMYSTSVIAKPYCISFHPAVIPMEDQETSWKLPWKEGVHFASMHGFFSPWKDIDSLLSAFLEVKYPLRFVLAGPLWNQRLNFHYKKIGLVDMYVISKYIAGHQLLHLIKHTDFAIFPYCNHPCFQGSGALANYLFHGVPTIAFNVANLEEQIDDAGILVDSGNLQGLSEAINNLLSSPKILQEKRNLANQRSSLFDIKNHAKNCLKLYKSIAR
jgi:glycosyltransferase involved in cell wall biosynthesis